jgi:hypothetical protein
MIDNYYRSFIDFAIINNVIVDNIELIKTMNYKRTKWLVTSYLWLANDRSSRGDGRTFLV